MRTEDFRLHRHELDAVMNLAIALLPAYGNNLTVAFGVAVARYTIAVKMAAAHPVGIEVPAGHIRDGSGVVRVDEQGYFLQVTWDPE